MATPKFATVIRRAEVGEHAVVLEFTMQEPSYLDFQGGKYIIVHTGIEVGEGKTHKRPYSIFSNDSEQKRFELAVKRIDGCLGSPHMHGLKPGDKLQFSGPWGTLWPDDDRPADSLVVATDNGITAAVSLVNSQLFRPRLSRSRLCWFVESDGYFLDRDFVSKRLPATLGSFEVVTCAPVGDHARVGRARQWLAQSLTAGAPEQAFLVGDGDVVGALRGELVAAGLPEDAVRIENFFNRPPKA
ncbi:MAG: FAD-dependent oxidoreductase [Myxococcales bacterium]|nr:FAD-dependent oxidoreductase [Myxococcales bacterium]